MYTESEILCKHFSYIFHQGVSTFHPKKKTIIKTYKKLQNIEILFKIIFKSGGAQK